MDTLGRTFAAKVSKETKQPLVGDVKSRGGCALNVGEIATS